VPYLETFNPAASKLIWQTADVLRGDGEILSKLVDNAWSQCLLEAGDDYVAINPIRAQEYSQGMQRHLVRRAIAHLRPDLRDISFEAVANGVDQIRTEKPYAEIDLIAGIKLVSEPGTLWLAEWEADLPTGIWPQVVQDRTFLDLDGEIKLQSGWQITAVQIASNDSQYPLQDAAFDSDQAWLDLERIELPLLVRARLDGDRFRPFGMDGHSQKLSDFMINQKIPHRARKGWPLVCSGDEIIWVAGCRPAHSFEISGQTKTALKLDLRRTDANAK
jgi:tRNA(Ile)-lysidine synthase